MKKAAQGRQFLFQEQRNFAEVQYRDEHEETDEESSGNVLNNRLSFEAQRFAT